MDDRLYIVEITDQTTGLTVKVPVQGLKEALIKIGTRLELMGAREIISLSEQSNI